jgi:hypothetical protein
VFNSNLVGSCAVTLIVRVVSALLIAGTRFFVGRTFGKELAILLKTLDI